MKVLIVGGAGHVGTMTLPYMKSHHQFRVLDLSPPQRFDRRIYRRFGGRPGGGPASDQGHGRVHLYGHAASHQ